MSGAEAPAEDPIRRVAEPVDRVPDPSAPNEHDPTGNIVLVAERTQGLLKIAAYRVRDPGTGEVSNVQYHVTEMMHGTILAVLASSPALMVGTLLHKVPDEPTKPGGGKDGVIMKIYAGPMRARIGWVPDDEGGWHDHPRFEITFGGFVMAFMPLMFAKLLAKFVEDFPPDPIGLPKKAGNEGAEAP